MRLSQQRENDAKEALHRGWDLWKDLENGTFVLTFPGADDLTDALRPADSPQYPPAPSRLTCVKLFLELSEHVPALQILNRLEDEDDEDSEVWYLSGWAWWTLGETRRPDAQDEEVESQAECWSESRLCLENYLRVRRPASSPSP